MVVKKVREELGLPVAALLDTKGPEIRLGKFKDKQKFLLKKGQTFTLTVDEIEGDQDRVSISYKNLVKDIQVGSKILLDGKDITNMGAEKIVAEGMALSPEGRHIFPDLTVQDNLEMGAYLRHKDKEGVAKDMQEIFEMFPRLEERRKQLGKTLSGGEQQMLAIARALMSNPKILMLDEPSTGLAPLVVKEIFRIVKRLNEERGLTVLLVEQNAKMALAVADRGYVLKNGEIVMSDTGANLLNDDSIRAAYLGYKENK